MFHSLRVMLIVTCLPMHRTNPMVADLSLGGQPNELVQIFYWGANTVGSGSPVLRFSVRHHG
jgi:hypothetical protein